MAGLVIVGSGADEDFVAAFSMSGVPIHDCPVAYFSAEFLLCPQMVSGWEVQWSDRFLVAQSLVKFKPLQRVWRLTGERDPDEKGYFQGVWPD